MKPLFKTLSISVVSAVIGGAIVFGALKYNPSLRLKAGEEKLQETIQNKFDGLLDDSFFDQNDPFEGMKKMRSKHFDSWFSNKFSGPINEISKREDSEFVYYDIQVENLNETSVETKIENGYITILGSLEKKDQTLEKDESAQSIFKSTFKRTFPLPEHIDQDKMQMIPEKDKVVLKFPKLKSYGASMEKQKNIRGYLTI